MSKKSTNPQRRPMPKPVKWTGYESLRTDTNLLSHMQDRYEGSTLEIV